MRDFEMVGLEDRISNLDYKFKQNQQVMSARWNAQKQALAAKLNVEVMRGRMTRQEAQFEATKFAEAKRIEAQDFNAKYDIERNRLMTFYQPANEEPEVIDPIKQYKALSAEKSDYESQVGEFVEMPAGKSKAPVSIFRRGSVPFAAGGLKVKEYEYIDDGKGGMKRRMYLRDARPDEMRRWATAKANLEDINRKLAETRRNRHIAARSSGSAFDPTGGGTFGDKVNRTKQKTSPKPSPESIDYSTLSDEELERIISGG